MNWLDIIKKIIEMHSLYIKSYSDHLSPNMSFPFLRLFSVVYLLSFTALLKSYNWGDGRHAAQAGLPALTDPRQAIRSAGIHRVPGLKTGHRRRPRALHFRTTEICGGDISMSPRTGQRATAGTRITQKLSFDQELIDSRQQRSLAICHQTQNYPLRMRCAIQEKFNFTEPEFAKTFKCVKIHEKW